MDEKKMEKVREDIASQLHYTIQNLSNCNDQAELLTAIELHELNKNLDRIADIIMHISRYQLR